MRSEQEIQELRAYYEQLLVKAQTAHLQAQDEEARQQIYRDVLSIELATIALRFAMGESDNAVPGELHRKYGSDLKVLAIPPRKR